MARSASGKVAARDVLNKLGFEPIEHMVSVATHPQCPPQLKHEVCKALLPYVHARKLDIDVVDERQREYDEFENRVHEELMKDAGFRKLCDALSDMQVGMRKKLRQAVRASVLDDVVQETELNER